MHNTLVSVLPHIIDGDDVGIVESRRRLRFPDETLPAVGTSDGIQPKKLDGDGPVQASVNGAVDHAHTSRAEFLDNPIV
jgi:hypothetical protein